MTHTHKQELKDFEFNFIELKKFKLPLHQCDTIAKKWIYFIQNASSFGMIPNEYKDIKEFTTALESASMYIWSEKELEVYDYISMQEGKRISELQTAKLDGIEEGMQKGIEKGILTVAKNLLDVLDNQTISLKTGLSIETIEQLRGDIK